MDSNTFHPFYTKVIFFYCDKRTKYTVTFFDRWKLFLDSKPPISIVGKIIQHIKKNKTKKINPLLALTALLIMTKDHHVCTEKVL